MWRSPWSLVGAAVLAIVVGCRPAHAASGGPDSFGYTWRDAVGGCSTSSGTFGASAQTFTAATAMQGPFNLGFTMAYFGNPVTQVWVSPYGYVTFSAGQPNSGTPGILPSGGGTPNNMIAAHWANCLNADITVEATAGEFHIRWMQHLTSFATQETHLFLSVDGGWRVAWRGSFAAVRCVGYEDASGTVGTTLFHDPNTTVAGDETRAPSFPDPNGGQSVCVAAPILLDCSAPLAVACGETVSGTLPATDPSPASIYSCSGNQYRGNERVVQLTVTSPQQVSVSVDNPALDILRIGAGECREGNCLQVADNQIDYPILFAGTYTFVLDKLAVGGGDAFRFTASCVDPYSPISCGDSVAGDTSGRAGMFTSYACTAQALSGPESLYRLTLPTQQNLVATLQTSNPDLWVILYDLASFEARRTCLAAGRHGAGVFDAPAGDYVIIVDGANGAAASFVLDIACGPQLDCGSATQVSCATSISGDTSTSPARVAVYNCAGEALVGGEDVYTFTNPVEQTIDARFTRSLPGHRIMLFPACGEGECLLVGASGVSCALFPPGNYFLIVDGTESGPYEFELNCSQIFRGVDLRVSAIDASPLSGACTSLDVAGNARITVSNLGDADAPGGFDLVVFEDGTPPNGLYDGPVTDNLLGTATVTGALPRGQSRIVDVPCAGRLRFRDNVILAMVDSSFVVAEVAEDNNLYDTGRACEYRPPVGVFNPTIEWAWTTSTNMPTYDNVDTVPLVADINGNGVPDVIFNAGEPPNGFGDGVVRALDGRSGAELFTASGADVRVHSSSNLALADLSGDTLPEIIGISNVTGQQNTLVAIDNTGLRYWTSDPLVRHPARTQGGGAPFIADLDCDGRPEVIYGANVFNDAGQLVNAPPDPVGTLGINGGGDGSIAIAVDVDDDGRLDVVAGPTAYRYEPGAATMSIIWQNTAVPDGYPAAGNFDDDPAPEIAITADGSVYLLEGDTGALKWQRQIPRGGGGCPVNGVAGGPPTVADFDGDCAAEVGAAGADYYTVFEGDGTVKWSSPINDCSSHRTASTVFDFDGDGAAEVAFADMEWLHVFRGIDGSEVARLAGDSHTWTEMVSIADVDADNNAEIILPLNPRYGRLNGIQVIGDADDNWVNTRRIWNQHQYHIGNINEDSSVPPTRTGSCEVPSHLIHNTYRDQIGTAVYSAPDITISIESYEIELVNDGGVCRRQVRITAVVGNGGGIAVGTPFTAWFWRDDGAGGRQNLVSQVIPDLPPRDDPWRITVVVPDPGVGSVDIHAVADDDGAGRGLINECREDNNSCVVTVTNTGLPIDPPDPLGPALRVTNHGNVQAADISADLRWDGDAGLPRPPGDHYHVYQSRNDRGRFLARLAGIEPVVGIVHPDLTPRTPDAALPSVYYYKVVPADDCEQEALQ